MILIFFLLVYFSLFLPIFLKNKQKYITQKSIFNRFYFINFEKFAVCSDLSNFSQISYWSTINEKKTLQKFIKKLNQTSILFLTIWKKIQHEQNYKLKHDLIKICIYILVS
jgi:hypothetical protein